MSDDPTQVLEQRVGDALHAEVDGVTPGADSLGPIRGRARAARRRRRVLAGAGAAVVVGAVALSVPALRDDRTDVSTRPDPAPTTTPAPSTTAPPPTAVAPDLDAAVWPDPAGELFDDPVEATRSFVEAVVGVSDPRLSEFAPQGPDAGEVTVARRGEDGQATGIASTVSLRRLDGEHWFVTGAVQPFYMQIDSPLPVADVASPLTVTGTGSGYEGTVVVELRSRSASADVLAEEVTIAGAAEPQAFSVDLTFAAAPQVAVLVAHDDPGIENGVPSFAALPVRLGAPSSGAPGGPTPTTGSESGAGFELGSQPLWPFRSYAEAEEWRAAAAEGHQPWHAGAEETAALFTASFLGFTEIDEITSTDVRADEAWIGVGYREAAGGPPSTSAVVHLVRFGPHADSPWEVVGTRDTSLTLDTPRYGTPTSSPATVGGTVTGVDECLVVQVRQPSSAAPLGEAPCVPAGGEGVPWRTTVAWSGASDPALTVVVWTGGHVQDVERFAVTGVPG